MKLHQRFSTLTLGCRFAPADLIAKLGRRDCCHRGGRYARRFLRIITALAKKKSGCFASYSRNYPGAASLREMLSPVYPPLSVSASRRHAITTRIIEAATPFLRWSALPALLDALVARAATNIWVNKNTSGGFLTGHHNWGIGERLSVP